MINRINSTCSFKCNNQIIDSHVHLGKMGGKTYRPETLVEFSTPNEQGKSVKAFFASALECLVKENGKYAENETSGNLNMVQNIKNANAQDVIKPLLSCQPDCGNADNIETLLKSGEKFYGFKFHPMGAGLNADSTLYDPYMKLAQKYKLTTVFHSDATGTMADPRRIYNLAKRTPNVPVVLYHMSLAPAKKVSDLTEDEINQRGIGNARDKWIWDVREKWNQDGIDAVKESLTKKDANLYLETSWTKPETVVKAIKEVGADRVLFGTDAPIGDFGEFATKEKYYEYVDSIQNAIRTEFKEKADGIIEKVFYQNAEGLFKQQTFPPVITETVSRTKPGKILGIAAGIVGAGVGLFALNKHAQANKAKNIQIPKQQLYRFTAFA